MNPPIVLRKPKLHFETADRPAHVTFDDGHRLCRILAWSHFSEARWENGNPNTIEIEIGDWLVALRGHNLGPLLVAIGGPTLALVRAIPTLANDSEHENDTFVTAIHFSQPPPTLAVRDRPRQIELGLGE
jgi:hypothetical protein